MNASIPEIQRAEQPKSGQKWDRNNFTWDCHVYRYFSTTAISLFSSVFLLLSTFGGKILVVIMYPGKPKDVWDTFEGICLLDVKCTHTDTL